MRVRLRLGGFCNKTARGAFARDFWFARAVFVETVPDVRLTMLT